MMTGRKIWRSHKYKPPPSFPFQQHSSKLHTPQLELVHPTESSNLNDFLQSHQLLHTSHRPPHPNHRNTLPLPHQRPPRSRPPVRDGRYRNMSKFQCSTQPLWKILSMSRGSLDD